MLLNLLQKRNFYLILDWEFATRWESLMKPCKEECNLRHHERKKTVVKQTTLWSEINKTIKVEAIF